MKILFILELYYPNIGGIEKLFKSLAEELVVQGHDVRVITTRFRNDLPAREELKGVNIKRLKLSSRFLFTFFGVWGMLKEARKADIIHTTSFNAAFPARIAGWLTRKKVIITFHEAWGKLWFKLPYASLISKILYFLYEKLILHFGFHKYIAVSDYTAESLIKLGVRKNKVLRIYNGLEYSEYDASAYIPPDNFVFTYFGRLGISKGIDHILEAAPGILKQYQAAHLKMIIPKNPSSFLNRVTNALGKLPEERYTLLHHLDTDQLQKELQHSSCVLIPSYSEGFCYAAAESIALGIPIISSGKGALTEVVCGKHIIMDSFDDKGLMEALQKAHRGEWFTSPVKQFHFTHTMEQYLKLYKKLGSDHQ
ncbi:MAG: glycosyltransferase family 4 protein [Bacteroidota bacterium]